MQDYPDLVCEHSGKDSFCYSRIKTQAGAAHLRFLLFANLKEGIGDKCSEQRFDDLLLRNPFGFCLVIPDNSVA